MSEHPLVIHRTQPAPIVAGLMARVRPEWQAKSLIERVQRLLPTDPSSACQRLLNAAVHDLRQKVVIAGLDIAEQAARHAKLPPVTKAEDVENYPTDKLLDLAFHMGILTHPEWRRIKRCYDIRRDLEHEDDQYEAGVEDCVYVFTTCIEVVLSRDPVHLLKVTDVKEVVEQPVPLFPKQELLEDYRNAPDPRQLEILKFLVATALKPDNPDIVRQSAYAMLGHLQAVTRNPAKLELAKDMQEKVGRQGLTLILFKVSNAAGVLAYLKDTSRRDFFAQYLHRLASIGDSWRAFTKHREPLEELEDVGGLTHCPDDVARGLLRWITLCYVGTPGGRTSYGHIRPVFFSDTAAPIIERLVAAGGSRVLRMLKDLRDDPEVKKRLASSKDVAARYEDLLDKAGDK
jgi:hypothetical protein